MKDATPDPRSAGQSTLAFGQSLSRGDLESAAACFARDTCLITPDATAIHGREQIRPVLAQLVARRIEGAWKLAIAAPWGWGQTIV